MAEDQGQIYQGGFRAAIELRNLGWLLPTNDQIDVVLKDRLGRFVAVEVEVNCDSG
jgi:hypothetical protein